MWLKSAVSAKTSCTPCACQILIKFENVCEETTDMSVIVSIQTVTCKIKAFYVG